MPRDEPGFIVAPGECDELGAQSLDCFERPHPEQVFLQGSDEALGDAIALEFTGAMAATGRGTSRSAGIPLVH